MFLALFLCFRVITEMVTSIMLEKDMPNSEAERDLKLEDLGVQLTTSYTPPTKTTTTTAAEVTNRMQTFHKALTLIFLFAYNSI